METYDALFRELQSMLDRDYPNAPPELRRSTAFGIGVLLDRAGTMDWLGLGREPLTLAREAISGLLNELARADESAEEREQRVGF